jgi:hypothetical protein
MIQGDPRRYNTPDRPTLHEADVPQLGAALLALTREVWVLTDRLTVLEAVLARHGIDAAAEIEAFQPDAAVQARLDAKGAALVAAVVEALGGVRAD